MKRYRLFLMTGLSIIAFSACTVAQDQQGDTEQRRSQSGQERKGPPPEAFTACEGKSSGTSCSVETPRGTMTGTCIDPRSEGKLVCAPSGGKRPPR